MEPENPLPHLELRGNVGESQALEHADSASQGHVGRQLG